MAIENIGEWIDPPVTEETTQTSIGFVGFPFVIFHCQKGTWFADVFQKEWTKMGQEIP